MLGIPGQGRRLVPGGAGRHFDAAQIDAKGVVMDDAPVRGEDVDDFLARKQRDEDRSPKMKPRIDKKAHQRKKKSTADRGMCERRLRRFR